MKKEECIKMLRDNDTFKSILRKAKDDKEKRHIKSYAENFIVQFYDSVYAPLQKLNEENPGAIKEALDELMKQESSRNKENNSGEDK